MKILKRKILFCLASELDFFNKNEGYEYKTYAFLYWRLANYQSSSIRGAVLQLVSDGNIDKIMRNSTAFFKLTSRGRDRLLSFYTISIGQKKVWDRIWRIVIFQERKSNKEIRILRRGLKTLGFKKLSRGVYLTPLPISAKLREFLLANNFTAQVTVIESRKLLVGDNEQLAKQIWQLEDIRKGYVGLIGQINRLLRQLRIEKRLIKREKSKFSLILDQYFSLLEVDPGLPKKLLLADWPIEKAKDKFLKLAVRVKELENSKI